MLQLCAAEHVEFCFYVKKKENEYFRDISPQIALARNHAQRLSTHLVAMVTRNEVLCHLLLTPACFLFLRRFPQKPRR